MDRKSFFNKQSHPEFKRKGSGRVGNRSNSSHYQVEDSSASDTVYRILCEHKKIGSVIGKGGNIVRALRDETKAKITVTDRVPGSEDRVIVIYSPPTRVNKKDNNGESPFEMHCAAQDALIKVHERIIEEDIGGKNENDKSKEVMVTARLLVPNSTVGCLIGKKGDVIQRLRSETGASIRVLSAEHLPACAMSTDELVQISGNPVVVKRALYEVSTRLHQSPKKEQPPLPPSMPHGRHGYYPPGPPVCGITPPSNPMRDPYYHDDPRSTWNEGGFRGGPPIDREGAPVEFSMKILCPATKIGGVIGKGGCNVKQIEQETGAGVFVEDVSSEQERVIRVSAVEAPWDPSQTINAILQLQDKTSEVSEKGTITTRLLVPSKKVGCLLGQGGHIINEMRRRTHADIRILTKEDKPKWAAGDVELVQISGNFRVAKDALAEISSRLRERVFQNADGGGDPTPVPPVRGYGPPGRLHADGPYAPGPVRPEGPGPMKARGYGGYEGGGHDYEGRSYPVHPSDAGYRNINSNMERRMPNHAVDSAVGGNNRNEIVEERWKRQDRQYVGPDGEAEFRASSGHPGVPRTTHYDYSAPQDYYQRYPHNQDSTYPNTNASQDTYNDVNNPQIPYKNIDPQQAPYPNHTQNDPYHASYQGPYQY